MAVEGDGDVFDLVVWIALGNGICALAFGAAHHVADAGDGFAHVFGFVGHGDYLAAVAGGVAKADDAFAVLSDGHTLPLMCKMKEVSYCWVDGFLRAALIGMRAERRYLYA